MRKKRESHAEAFLVVFAIIALVINGLVMTETAELNHDFAVDRLKAAKLHDETAEKYEELSWTASTRADQAQSADAAANYRQQADSWATGAQLCRAVAEQHRADTQFWLDAETGNRTAAIVGYAVAMILLLFVGLRTIKQATSNISDSNAGDAPLRGESYGAKY